MAVTKSVFGKGPNGEEVVLYSISNSNGMKVCISSLGATIVNLFVPDKDGNVADVVLGYDTPEEYFTHDAYFGAVVGPNANRIDKASFELNGETYQLEVNDGVNNLHSHVTDGYHRRVWDASALENGVLFTLEDADGNMGFPGNKKVEVCYTLNEENELKLHYHASTDKATIINLTNHSYFNLDGHASGSVLEHELWLNASHFTPVVAGAIPTGEIAPVKGTVMDFTEAKTVGRDINAKEEQLELTGGYDHNWVLDGCDGNLQHFATLKAPKSGRVMKVFTTLPGVQFYAGNYLDGRKGKEGAHYQKRQALCLETQFYPDTIHHANFPSCVFDGKKPYDSETVFRFE
jgi:aldose 1-epimerase